MAQQSLGEVDGDAAKEDEEHEEPLEVLGQSGQEGALACAVTHRGEREIAKTVEDDDERDPDLPAVDVVLVDVALEPADDEVVGNGHDPGGADGVVSADVGDDIDFGSDGHVGPDELAE